MFLTLAEALHVPETVTAVGQLGYFFGLVLVLGHLVCWVIAAIVFVQELSFYFAQTEGPEPELSVTWAIFLNVFYFQYKFHELYVDESSRITPSTM